MEGLQGNCLMSPRFAVASFRTLVLLNCIALSSLRINPLSKPSISRKENSVENHKSSEIVSLPKVCQIVKIGDEERTKVTNNSVKMVGACGFEPQTPTVSR